MTPAEKAAAAAKKLSEKKAGDIVRAGNALEAREAAAKKQDVTLKNRSDNLDKIEEKLERRDAKTSSLEEELTIRMAEYDQVRERQAARDLELSSREKLLDERAAIIDEHDLSRVQNHKPRKSSNTEDELTIEVWPLDSVRHGGKTHKPGDPSFLVTQEVCDRLVLLKVVTDQDPAN